MKFSANMLKTYKYAVLNIIIYHQTMHFIIFVWINTEWVCWVLYVFRQCQLSELIKSRQWDADRQEEMDEVIFRFLVTLKM